MKLSKVYKDKKKGIHVCFKGSHYEAPEGSKVNPDERAEVGPAEDDQVVVKQGDVVEQWKLIGAYTGGTSKPTEKAARCARAKKEAKDVRKRTPIEWKNREVLAGGDAVLARIKAAAPNEQAYGVLAACWKNWQHQKNVPLFQGLHYPDAEATKRVRELGQQLMVEFGQDNKQ